MNILILPVASVPQHITVTIWGLLNRNPAFVPSAIHVISTAPGRDMIVRQGDGAEGRSAELFRYFGIEPVRLSIHVPETDDGQELLDIRTAGECTVYANTVSRLIALYAHDADTRIHVSLSGGRKIMSYFSGVAMSLFGRDQDELSLVVIAPEDLERCPDFWYPGQPESFVRHAYRQIEYRPANARIDIAPVPFVRLSHLRWNESYPVDRVDFCGIMEQTHHKRILKQPYKVIHMGYDKLRTPQHRFRPCSEA